jgi:PiT family inorganic phosphate transporter
MTIFALLVAASLFVAYANGANDNFKGVATLYGSGTAGYSSALAWATLTTFAGSLCSVFLSDKLVKAFSAKGLVPDGVAATPEFLAAVALGAALTIFLATMTGFPISTTHALIGGLVGAGVSAAEGSVNFSLLGKNYFLPLIGSPLLAMFLAGTGYPFFRWALRCTGINREWCVCEGVRERFNPIPKGRNLLAFARDAPVEMTTDTAANCSRHGQKCVLGVGVPSLLDASHFLSAGAMSFARGLNDAPKIVGLMLVLKALHVQAGLLLVAAVMAIGGLLHSRKVAETVSQRITHMNHSQGFAANLVTSLLVLTASYSGLPVSTTHVSCGSLFGIGLKTRQADSRVIQHVVMSWVLTLPIAALLAAGTSWILH